jgi:hypothetical protein
MGCSAIPAILPSAHLLVIHIYRLQKNYNVNSLDKTGKCPEAEYARLSFDRVVLKPRLAIWGETLLPLASLEVFVQAELLVLCEIQDSLVSFNKPARDNN